MTGSIKTTRDTPKRAKLVCEIHGLTIFWKETSRDKYFRYRCKDCNSEDILNRKIRVKGELIAERGGACERCGYNKSISALSFHHRDRKTKSFNLSAMTSHSRAKVLEEAKKCILLCSNCHHETEDELRAISSVRQSDRSTPYDSLGSNPRLPITHS